MRFVNKRILFVVILIIFLLVFSIVAYYFSGNSDNKNEVFCTQEAKLCNNGIYVSRNSSNQCKFDKCPEELVNGKG